MPVPTPFLPMLVPHIEIILAFELLILVFGYIFQNNIFMKLSFKKFIFIYLPSTKENKNLAPYIKYQIGIYISLFHLPNVFIILLL